MPLRLRMDISQFGITKPIPSPLFNLIAVLRHESVILGNLSPKPPIFVTRRHRNPAFRQKHKRLALDLEEQNNSLKVLIQGFPAPS